MTFNVDFIEFQSTEHHNTIKNTLQEINNANIIQRIWDHDQTVWRNDPTEITNRLGWLRIMDIMREEIDRLKQFKQDLQNDGYTHVLLLGMGGSSLAPEVFSDTFHDAPNRLWLEILDSTDPGAVLAYDKTLDIQKTLFIVATKSGGTAETLSAFKYFYNRALDVCGDEKTAGKHFAAITDPGSKLEDMVKRYHFRDIFINDPNIGGRYSVLSFFGIVPATLAGVDVERLLDNASEMADHCKTADSNPGLVLGAIMGELAKAGRDKLTIIASPKISHFGDWAEQLIAESTGKDGKGILPVVGESPGNPDSYGNDRLFIHMRLPDDDTNDKLIAALSQAGHPTVTIALNDRYDLGGQFFLWEMATSIVGHLLDIQPFDQPNVEAAKVLARAKIEDYQETGQLEKLTPVCESNGIQVIGDVQATSVNQALHEFLDHAADNAYIAIHAYVTPNDETTAALQALQTKLRDNTKLATTIGYGPRFLHSTGQLHKGDAGNGLFIQITSDITHDVDIPDDAGEATSSMSFGTLRDAQALGDRQALLDANRHVIRFHLSNTVERITALTASL